MKRTKVISEIVKVLKTYEGCKLDKKCANEILNKLEDLGMNQDFKDWEYWKSEERIEINKLKTQLRTLKRFKND